MGSFTMQSATSQAVSFDEDLFYRNAAESLAAMHRMFINRIVSR